MDRTREEWKMFLSTHMFLECVDEILKAIDDARKGERERCANVATGFYRDMRIQYGLEIARAIKDTP